MIDRIWCVNCDSCCDTENIPINIGKKSDLNKYLKECGWKVNGYNVICPDCCKKEDASQ